MALIPGALYEVKPGIKSINPNNFPLSKIIAKHQSRFFFLKIRLSFWYVYSVDQSKLLPDVMSW